MLNTIRKHIYGSKDKDLIKFIHKNIEQRGNMSRAEYKNKLETINRLDLRTINIGLARMAGINEDNNISWISFVSSLLVLYIAVFIEFVEQLIPERIISSSIHIFILALYLFTVVNRIRVSGKAKITLKYFTKLLEIAKENK